MKRREKNTLKPTSHQNIIFLIVFLFGFGQTVHADIWEQVQPPPPEPDARRGHSMVEGKDGPYMTDGVKAAGTVLNDLWEFNKDNGAWEKEAPDDDPTSGSQGLAAVFINGKLYVFGGHNEGGNLTMFWVYDPVTKKWQPETSMPPPGRSYHSMVVIGNQILLFGGKKYDVDHKYGDLWCFGLLTREWEQKASIPAGRERYGHSTFTANDKMYVWGGRGYEYFTDMWVYDPVTNTWAEVTLQGEQPRPRKHQTTFRFSELIDPDTWGIAGGTGPASSSKKTNGTVLRTSNSDTVFSDTWKYNIGTNTWTRLADLPVGLTQAAAALLDTANNHVLLFGGMKIDSTVSGDTYMYLPEGTGVEKAETLPAEFCLSQNYPNPFNATTSIHVSLPSSEFVSLKVYDLLGREVKSIVNRQLSAGKHTFTFDAEKLSSGIYLYRLTTGNFSETKKMILQK